MSDILQSSQHCGRHGNTIFEAVAAIRDIVAYTEVHKESVSIDNRFQGSIHPYFPHLLIHDTTRILDLVRNYANE